MRPLQLLHHPTARRARLAREMGDWHQWRGSSRKANAGGFNLRQIILATFDQKIHTRASADTQKLFSEIYEEIIGLKTIPDTNMPANWGHMVGYDSQYYGYLVSESKF